MSRRSFQLHCLACGRRTLVKKHELDHAALPKCRWCGGALSMSAAGDQELAKVHDAQKGVKGKKRKPTAENPVRIIPEHETARYTFSRYVDLFTSTREREIQKGLAFADVNPIEFYNQCSTKLHARTEAEIRQGATVSDRQYMLLSLYACEQMLYQNGHPYYKVWPSIAEALQHTEMRVDGEHFHLPYTAFELRFPDHEDNPVAPVGSMLVAALPSGGRADRDWAFVMGFTNGKMDQSDAMMWLSDIPIKKGMLLEDSLDQTSLVNDVPDPGLARRLMRIAVGVTFFGMDNHEVILPDLQRRTIERYQRAGRQPTAAEAAEAIREARAGGLNGFTVGSEITLPRPVAVERTPGMTEEEHRQLTHSHIRRCHLAMVPCGEGKKERKLVWRRQAVVRPDLPMQSGHGHRIKL